MSYQPNSAPAKKIQPLAVVLFLLAAILIGRSSVIQNANFLHDGLYESGHFKMPFEGRYMMVPVLHWAQHSHFLIKASSLLRESSRGPEDLMVQITDVFCLIALGYITLRLRGRFRPSTIFPWLAPWLLLWVTVCVYVARYESRFYLPYDFPSVLVFSIGLIAIVECRPLLFLVTMILGTYNRETTIFLLPIWLICNFASGRIKALSITAIGLLGWVLVRIQILRWIGNPSSGLNIPLVSNLHNISPHHWAQVASVGGFLAIPMWLGRRLIHDELLRKVWIGCIPFIVATLIFGRWLETRIFGELDVLVAITAAMQFEQYLHREMADQLAALETNSNIGSSRK